MSESITCPVCGRTSWHPQDVAYGYCGNCHAHTTAPDGKVSIPASQFWEDVKKDLEDPEYRQEFVAESLRINGEES